MRASEVLVQRQIDELQRLSRRVEEQKLKRLKR